MANTDSAFYVSGLKKLLDAQFKWAATGGSAMTARLTDNPTYTFNGTAQDTHTTIADITAVVGTYPGDVALTMVDPTEVLGSNFVKCDCSDITWNTVSGQCGGIVIYNNDANDFILCYLGFSSPVTATAGNVVVNINPNGAFTLSWTNQA